MANGKKTNGARQTGHYKKKFLEEYRQTGIVRLACVAAAVGRTTVYRWIDECEAFKADFEQAREEATDLLEEEARRRAYAGVEEPVFYLGINVATIRKYSDTLLIFMLKANREKFREKQQHDVTIRSYKVVQDT